MTLSDSPATTDQTRTKVAQTGLIALKAQITTSSRTGAARSGRWPGRTSAR